ncbi:hypothetical protein chiPu_0024243, partial [Chiloscyllium punctatum]|nr:hypothetical protein [Chiloscyllium punctatum]
AAWFTEDEENRLENLWVKAAASMPIWNQVAAAGGSATACYLLQPTRDIDETTDEIEQDKSDSDLVCIPY